MDRPGAAAAANTLARYGINLRLDRHREVK